MGVFAGQPSKSNAHYRRTLGPLELEDVGYSNAEVELSGSQLLENIHHQQKQYAIPPSKSLAATNGLGACLLDVEMETGTGKTYVYIKTMFELNRRYGWSKFIVVVPSVAIREGVRKSFAMLEEHFMELYGKKARYFIYDSSNLNQIDSFCSDASINVMIINMQAFNSSFDSEKNVEDKKGDKAARIIYTKRDDFQSRRPIDVIAANRPIVIMDEPQKMEGNATQKALRNFNPLFVLNYSATHKTRHNCVYALDALDAYKQRLVKKIQVKGITVQNLPGTQSYIYFDSIVLSPSHAPEARLEIEIKGASGISRRIRRFRHGESLYDVSKLSAYKDFTITDIDPLTNTIHFLNGKSLRRGEVTGDISEKAIQRIQIRETVKSHFEKERSLFRLGIKCLSLFFVDEVANYKSYDADGNEVQGPMWRMFEEEYNSYLSEHIDSFDADYQKYLRRFEATEVHSGYFSIDKNGRSVNNVNKEGKSANVKKDGTSDDISAYDLILKNKERLLSFDEPTRFIFSHSALREGWDNPNVFQICTLRHANSSIARRQEVGRGLRLCVDSNGNRMDTERLSEAVHDINKLTVVANESYSTFVEALQKETNEVLRERPKQATVDYFKGATIGDGEAKHTITEQEAIRIVNYLIDKHYIDEKYNILPSYHSDMAAGTLVPLGKKLQPIEGEVHKLVQSIFDPSATRNMVEDANAKSEVRNRTNKNFHKPEFKALWEEIHHRYVYMVHYDSQVLIGKAIEAIDRDLRVTHLQYVVSTGEQADNKLEFDGITTKSTRELRDVSTSDVPYDLVGDIARGATLTRRSVVRILKGIQRDKLLMFKNNPEEFIRKVSHIIREQKATMIVDHISYNRTENQYDSTIFTQEKSSQTWDKAYKAKKHILDYVFPDSNKEREFAEELDKAEEVCVYAKLPRSFQIPTPVGNYAPDWAIAFNDNMGIKHVFFIAETKGSMDSMQLTGVEKTKIDCAKKLFNNISTSKVRYDVAATYADLQKVIS